VVNYGIPVEYEGKTYKTVNIGNQTWFAENLNYDVEGSKCNGEGGKYLEHFDYGNSVCITKTISAAEVQTNCDKYGRLYDWITAMNLPPICNFDSCSSQIQSPHRGICPAGWHIPSDNDWDILINYIGGYETAGAKLKAKSGWNYGDSTDDYGFSALPGGMHPGSYFVTSLSNSDECRWDYEIGDYGFWWSTLEENENDNSFAYFLIMSPGGDLVDWGNVPKYRLHSVRCLQD
jgi:uncharacterized protein (TIGR02145 family)